MKTLTYAYLFPIIGRTKIKSEKIVFYDFEQAANDQYIAVHTIFAKWMILSRFYWNNFETKGKKRNKH